MRLQSNTRVHRHAIIILIMIAFAAKVLLLLLTRETYAVSIAPHLLPFWISFRIAQVWSVTPILVRSLWQKFVIQIVIVTSTTSSIIILIRPSSFVVPSVVVCVVFSLTSTGLVKAFLFVSILLVPTSIVETDVLGESIADIFVLLITSRLPPILTLTCIVVACAVAALIYGFRSLSPFISLSVRPAIVWVDVLLRGRRAIAFTATITRGRYHHVWIWKTMLLLSLFFVSSTNIFFNAIFDVVVDLRNKKFVQIVLNFKTELDQLTLALLAALKMTRASTFNAPFIFTGRIVLTESRRFTTLTQRRVSRCFKIFFLTSPVLWRR